MPPRSTRTRAAPKAAAPAPVVNGAAAASKKRKAADAETKAVPAKRAKGFDVKDLDDAIQDIDTTKDKKTKKTATATATATASKPAKPAARRAAAKTATAFSVEPTSSLTHFQKSPPDTSSLPVINEAPTDVLTVYIFGTGDMSGDLGLGPQKKSAKLPTAIPKLDARKEGSYRVVRLDCGGMHSIALTEDSKIVTWGGNDEGALGRNTDWDGGLRDMDAKGGAGDDADSEDSDDEALNPLESTPTHIPENSFPPGTKFTSVAAGDSCSFAVTDTGLVYGWGTFAVRYDTLVLLSCFSFHTC